MFTSDFTRRLFAYYRKPKKYIVNVVIELHHTKAYIDVAVVARAKWEAKQKAEELVKNDLEVRAYGLKSLGRQ
jgi:hypothetical protein